MNNMHNGVQTGLNRKVKINKTEVLMARTLANLLTKNRMNLKQPHDSGKIGLTTAQFYMLHVHRNECPK